MSSPINQQDFLFELGCEELPPKALTKLAKSLHQSLVTDFNDSGLSFSESQWFATPRRLAVLFKQLDSAQADKQVERLGPAVAAAFDAEGNAKPAALGFAKSCGVDIEQLARKATDKGERLAFVAQEKGQQTLALLPAKLEKAISQLPVPKAMRWGDTNYQFSRPVHWMLGIFGKQTIDFELFDVKTGNITFGHRFHAPAAIELEAADQYVEALKDAKVLVNIEQRKQTIVAQIEAIAKQQKAQPVINPGLLEEVTALVEWPVALLGNFDDSFLQVPAEALVSSMAEHQKYFHLTDQEGRLRPQFITVSNIESLNPESVIFGNEKVIRPRLADAKFFYDQDNQHSLASRTEQLKTIVFQNQLGTLYDKTIRVGELVKVIANLLDANETSVERAATLYKCDLVTDMVGEFPDLQGVMGSYYARNDGESEEVAEAMNEVYLPKFAGDRLPETVTGTILAIAERLDTLVGIFGIGQLPTGAKDPFALRRAALGVLRLISEKQLPLDLAPLIEASMKTFSGVELATETKTKLMEFFDARSLAMFQDKGIATQVIQSVQVLNISKPLDFLRRVEAVNVFSQTDACADLAEANKRVKNILQKSDFDASALLINQDFFETEEKDLFDEVNRVSASIDDLVIDGNYQLALENAAGLKDVVNRFFDKVMINAEDPKIRNNRLALIYQLRQLFLGIADISLLQK